MDEAVVRAGYASADMHRHEIEQIRPWIVLMLSYNRYSTGDSTAAIDLHLSGAGPSDYLADKAHATYD